MVDIEKFMEWAHENFPKPLSNHFTYDLLENVVTYANENFSRSEIVDKLLWIVPEVTKDEWESFLA